MATEQYRATCNYCGEPMNDGAGCTLAWYDMHDTKYRRLPYVTEDGTACHDCGVTAGQLHHPGCDEERCPACGGQSIACDCGADELGEDDF